MKARILLVCVLLATPALVPAASKEIQELQRDIALLQQQIKDLQRSQDEKFAGVIELARQAIEAANRGDKGVAVVQSNLEKSLRDLQQSVAAPVAGLGARLNDVSNNVNTLTQAVSDLTSLLNRMQSQLTDIKQQIAVMQAPVTPPQQQVPGGSGPGPGPGGPPQGSAPCTTGSSTSAYDAALRDYRGGKAELGVSEFNEYLRCYGNTELAPNAQFYIASYHFSQHDYETAVREFDLVLEKYGDNNKSPDAMLYKGRAMAQLPGQKTAATNEWKDLIKRYPRSDAAKLACDDLKAFGMNCPASPVTTTTPKKGAGRSKK
jgi:tol-pal system protein YbgF